MKDSPLSTEKKAEQLLNLGYSPVPIKPGTKRPDAPEWQKVDCASFVKDWSKGYGIGLRTDKNLIGIDIDIYHEDLVNWAVSQLRYLADGPILCRVGQPPKTLIPASCEGVEKKFTSDKWVDENGVINQIEILSHGQQFVAFGIHPGTKKLYQWDGDLLDHSLPTIRNTDIAALFKGFNDQCAMKGWNNTTVEKKAKAAAQRSHKESVGDAPGDVYNRSVSLETVLEHYGWTNYRGNYWTRPDKDKGVSGAVHDGVLYCFTSSTCLDERQCHDAFEILSRYEFDGDKSACAFALRREQGDCPGTDTTAFKDAIQKAERGQGGGAPRVKRTEAKKKDLSIQLPESITNPGGLISECMDAMKAAGISDIPQYNMPVILASIGRAISGKVKLQGYAPNLKA